MRSDPSVPWAPLQEDPRLDRASPLRPGNAVAAIILVDDNYLLQLRDWKPGIFFPGHWGCFGGGLDPGEDAGTALARELREELGLKLDTCIARLFTRYDFDLAFAGLAPIWRIFYEVVVPPRLLPSLSLGEGTEMRVFPPKAILAHEIELTPYDAFALWMHISARRLVGA